MIALQMCVMLAHTRSCSLFITSRCASISEISRHRISSLRGGEDSTPSVVEHNFEWDAERVDREFPELPPRTTADEIEKFYLQFIAEDPTDVAVGHSFFGSC
mmetsp:Transcript_75629/g.202474  ORF Transcript_75629/g.202474 Transcript_75629/m.202474 type:complete len:102 (-) Transcript_75629:227-532(-)